MAYTSTGINNEGKSDILSKISDMQLTLLFVSFILILLHYYIFPSIDSEITPSYIQII